jgi:predicted TIM-barrel fold metal-dependent hydrolase
LSVRHLAAAALIALSLPFSAVADQAAPTNGAVPPPTVDHHQHLMSPALARQVNGPDILPAVTPPAGIAALLAERGRLWNDAAGLQRLYAPDAQFLGRQQAGWINGPAAISTALVGFFGRGHGLRPARVDVNGAHARVTGYYVRLPDAPNGPNQPFGYLHLDLVRGADGQWRIATEMGRFPIAQPDAKPSDAAELIGKLDAAGIQRAVVLSQGFWWSSPFVPAPNDPDTAVRVENDWAIAQAALYPDRLIPFCSVSPLTPGAVAEVRRCAQIPAVKGVKVSFSMSGVDMLNPDHIAKARTLFAAVSQARLPMVAHIRSGPDYDARHVDAFLSQVMPAAPDIPVQIAHLWGGEAFAEAPLIRLADAVAAKRPGTQNLWFDVTEVAQMADMGPKAEAQLAMVAEEIRRIGLDRILFGSDGRTAPKEAWAQFRRIPLTDAEAAAVARNVAPWAASASVRGTR